MKPLVTPQRIEYFILLFHQARRRGISTIRATREMTVTVVENQQGPPLRTHAGRSSRHLFAGMSRWVGGLSPSTSRLQEKKHQGQASRAFSATRLEFPYLLEPPQCCANRTLPSMERTWVWVQSAGLEQSVSITGFLPRSRASAWFCSK